MQSKEIVITGNIGSGKSTLASMLRQRGYVVIDTDRISREIYEPESPTYRKLILEFGKDILNRDKRINRKFLSNLVFSDKNKLLKLEEITHADIILEVKKKIEELGSKIIFIEIPLYFESKALIDEILDIDEVWMVYSDKDIRIGRIMDRDGVDRKKAVDIINSQLDYAYYKDKVDELIVNNDGEEKYKIEIEDLFKRRNL
ncbi:MAG: dephospho-CoA kinase [Finegoldia sp.]|nr:dephospho-CoA kinase [Finegoldia sp.]